MNTPSLVGVIDSIVALSICAYAWVKAYRFNPDPADLGGFKVVLLGLVTITGFIAFCYFTQNLYDLLHDHR